MAFEELPFINSSFREFPLDIQLASIDYKLYGKLSYAFQNTNILKRIYNNLELSLYDIYIIVDMLSYIKYENDVELKNTIQKYYNIKYIAEEYTISNGYSKVIPYYQALLIMEIFNIRNLSFKLEFDDLRIINYTTFNNIIVRLLFTNQNIRNRALNLIEQNIDRFKIIEDNFKIYTELYDRWSGGNTDSILRVFERLKSNQILIFKINSQSDSTPITTMTNDNNDIYTINSVNSRSYSYKFKELNSNAIGFIIGPGWNIKMTNLSGKYSYYTSFSYLILEF
jgi:hypothetical protein